MAFPQVASIAPQSPAAAAGVEVGDEIRAMNGSQPRDVIDYQLLADDAHVTLELRRGGTSFEVVVEKHAGEPLGISVASAVFDRVMTCDNHCAFCFIRQLPRGMRRSLYVRDDDFRLSFLYGNFTTLTRFTELDLERIVSERLSPLYVSIHATDPVVRAKLLGNRRGATSLRWLAQLLDHGIDVHGQVVVCPGVNDGAVLEDTMAGILERFPGLTSLGVVPVGVSRFSRAASVRAHTADEVTAVLDTVGAWQERFSAALGRRLVFAADEYYLLAGRAFPEAACYEGFPQHENGIGMAAAFAAAFRAGAGHHRDRTGGFFRSVDGAPALGYRARHAPVKGEAAAGMVGDPPATRPVTILTGVYGREVLRPLLDEAGFGDVTMVGVANTFFGGNIGVTGLLTFADLARVLADLPGDGRVLLPAVCLSNGRFLDGGVPEDLPRAVEVIAEDGASLRRVLAGEAARRATARVGGSAR
jgi:putative radical SAM enzyme (TIGR03279 family)